MEILTVGRAMVAPAVAPAGRFYKSRKSRPCDACRRRKVACDMPAGPPCHRCLGRTQPCTFEHGPGLRKRPAPVRPAVPAAPGPAAALATAESLSASQSNPWLDDPAFFSWQLGGSLELSGSCAAVGRDSPKQRLPSFSSVVSSPSPSRPRPVSSAPGPQRWQAGGGEGHGQAEEPFTTNGSLEFLPGAFSFYVGPTGVADVHLLSRGPFGPGGLTQPGVKGLQYRRMQQHQQQQQQRPPSCPSSSSSSSSSSSLSSLSSHEATPPAIFGLTDHALLAKAEPKPDAEVTESAWTALWDILDSRTAWSLIQLYTRFVDPYFPILSRHQMPADPETLSNMSLALLTAVCATALPFVVYDRSLYALLLRPPSSEQLYRLCWLGIEQELHAPSLSTLQACLLLQQRLPTNLYLHDTAFSWSLMATAVSVAQTIGLHRDPSGWTSVPAWERRLRRRLWWALWAMEKWVALARGMPSHLLDDEADVEPLRPDDTDETLSPPADAARPHLFHLVGLTSILAEIQRTFYTLRATRQTADNLAVSLEAGRMARVRLCDWRDQLPVSLRFRQRHQAQALSIRSMLADGTADSPGDVHGDQRLDGNASLYLSYIVTHMALFRAFLRPLEIVEEAGGNGHSHDRHEPSIQAVMHGSLLCVREFVEFVEALTPTQWNAFWHGWSRANFAMAGSFMVLLLHVVSVPVALSGADGAGTASTAAAPETAESAGASADVDVASTARSGFETEYAQLLGWIKRWRWASRVSANGAGAKGLTNLGLLRVESFLGQFGELKEL